VAVLGGNEWASGATDGNRFGVVRYYGISVGTIDSDNPYFPYCEYCSSRRGFDQEGSMALEPDSDLYVIPGLEALQVPFNLRTEESASAFKQAK
jgi:hypothetical protein